MDAGLADCFQIVRSQTMYAVRFPPNFAQHRVQWPARSW
jgi:hypothetical protein